MEDVWRIATMGIIFFAIFGALSGIILAYAAKRFAVKIDPKIEAVRACLPGANCGACGFAGCESYAEAVVTDPSCPTNKCAPGKQTVAEKVAAITGKAAGAASPVVSVLRCSRNEGEVKKKYSYVGFDTCQGAAIAFGGPYECNFACIGYGDCEVACPFHAIHMKDNMPVIDPELCTGCGVCIKTCPKQVLQLMPKNALCYVPCNSRDSGKAVTNICKAGCIHCGACTRKAKDIVTMVKDRIEIDHEKCDEDCAKAGVWACSKQFIFRYTDPERQAIAVEQIKSEQAAKKASAARTQQQSEAKTSDNV
ncbi:MAG: Fe-S cluster domain-containing protein [Deltaproteobacteria bacterium]|nr:Fe-S cluster domain-containing protein [Deltaproteobacteria bacterium]